MRDVRLMRAFWYFAVFSATTKEPETYSSLFDHLALPAEATAATAAAADIAADQHFCVCASRLGTRNAHETGAKSN